MKALHLTTAVIETGTGLALLFVPSIVVELLLGVPLDSAASIALGRVAGLALITLGIACWFTRGTEQDVAANGLAVAILFYNGAVSGVLAWAGLGSGLTGIALWPAVGLHVVLAVWCFVCLKRSLILDLSK